MLVVARSLCANYKPTVVTCGKSNEAVSPSTFPRGAGEGNIYLHELDCGNSHPIELYVT